MDRIAYTPCPRCDGRGYRAEWTARGGVCFRCKGSREITVDLSKLESSLLYFRVRFVKLRAEARKGNRLAVQALSGCVQNGLRIREALDAARAALLG